MMIHIKYYKLYDYLYDGTYKKKINYMIYNSDMKKNSNIFLKKYTRSGQSLVVF